MKVIIISFESSSDAPTGLKSLGFWSSVLCCSIHFLRVKNFKTEDGCLHKRLEKAERQTTDDLYVPRTQVKAPFNFDIGTSFSEGGTCTQNVVILG